MCATVEWALARFFAACAHEGAVAVPERTTDDAVTDLLVAWLATRFLTVYRPDDQKLTRLWFKTPASSNVERHSKQAVLDHLTVNKTFYGTGPKRHTSLQCAVTLKLYLPHKSCQMVKFIQIKMVSTTYPALPLYLDLICLLNP